MPNPPRPMRLTPGHVTRVPPYAGPPLDDPEGLVRASDDDLRAVMARLLAQAPADGAVWVFAYGSLIWNPGFAFTTERVATVHGWHRAFCLGWMRRWRGCPDRPGLMMALDRGGSCTGVAFRLADGTMEENLMAILRREMPYRDSAIPPRWLPLRTAEGPLRAVAFPIDRRGRAYVGGLTEDAIVESLATSAGEAGTMAEYLHNTVAHLEERGIRDRYLWRLQRRVADRIDGVAQAADGATGQSTR